MLLKVQGHAGARLDMDPGGLCYVPAWIPSGILTEINSFIPSLFGTFPHLLSGLVVCSAEPRRISLAPAAMLRPQNCGQKGQGMTLSALTPESSAWEALLGAPLTYAKGRLCHPTCKEGPVTHAWKLLPLWTFW